MNYPLGGAFNSRINLNLREDKGWTYGARSFFSADDLPGVYTAFGGIKASATDSAVFEFMNEIKMYRESGITEDELQFLKNSIGQRDAREYETPRQKARFLGRIIHYDLDKDYVKEQTKIINSITKPEIDEYAKKYLKDDQMYIVVVGDEASNRVGLERLGYEIVLVDERGEIKSSNDLQSDH
jgi:zinc protease